MAKKSCRKHSNECQFYITLSEMKAFDKNYVAFGRIIQGYEIIKQIENVDCYLQRPVSKIQVCKAGEYKV